MKIKTTRFAELEIPDDRIITIVDGIIGIPDVDKYVLLEHDSEGTPFRWLQAVDNPNLAFIVMDPNLVVDNYDITLDTETAQKIKLVEENADFGLMVIVNIPRDNPRAMTVNLRAPIVVQLEKRIGVQAILPNEEYPIRHRLFADSEPETKKESV
jgi:flagellar assembly factor FliW